MKSTGFASWQGDLFGGSGTATLNSGAAGPLPVSWASRTEEAAGKTSPEELIAAAHAACYSMALSNVLAGAGNTAEKLDTKAVAKLLAPCNGCSMLWVTRRDAGSGNNRVMVWTV